MHPAPSLILFTSLSGLGFGTLFWMGLGLSWMRGELAWPALLVGYAIAFALAVSGLLASLFHLGHPERAWLAFSQWRTSWLSREGVAAVATLGVMGLFALLHLFAVPLDRPFDVADGPTDGLAAATTLLGLVGALLCLVTIVCTAMIYASLKAVPRWNRWATPVLFTAFALAGGALLNLQLALAAVLLAVLPAVQIWAFVTGDRALAESGTTLGTATGLDRTGDRTVGDRTAGRATVRLFEPPHTGPNYLLSEMVFRVGRKHRARLRLVALVCAGALPALLVVGAALTGSLALLFLALGTHLVGLFASRWLFYAEAEHVVGLYYGAHQTTGTQPATA